MTATTRTTPTVQVADMPTPAPSRAPRVTACADAVLARAGLSANPYFAALADGSMSLAGFRASQREFYHAVRYFPRPMAALLARLPDPAARLDILRNLVEEHGDFRPDRFHANTFARFLDSVGTRPPDPDAGEMAPAVHAFNSVLAAACGVHDPDVGAACLGVIEHAFAGLSAKIGAGVVRRGWVAEGELVHYALHAELDVRHAEEFFAVVESRWDDPAGRSRVRQGLELGAYAFDQLYRGLHAVADETNASSS